MAGARLSPPRGTGVLLALAFAPIIVAGCGQATGSAPSDADGELTSYETTERAAPQGTGGDDVLNGTRGGDVIRAGGGDDVVRGSGGNDELYGGEGRDKLYGGPGDDLVDAQDPGSVGEAGRDEISCGPGRDEVLMDADDGEKPTDCETAGVGAS